MRSHHFFDWDGFTFFAKIVLLLVLVGAVGRLGLLYTASSGTTALASPSLVLIQDAHPAKRSLSLTLSTTTSVHIINTLTIADTVPATGKFIAVDLTTMVLTLFQDGVATAKYPVLATGAKGSLYETPPGFYTVLEKEQDRWSDEDQTHLPWSVQFYGNYFIHGWPTNDDGSPVITSYTGGDIRLSTDDAKNVYDFSDQGIGIFVYDPISASTDSLTLDTLPLPPLSALSYLVADIDTGDVFLEHAAEKTLPVATVTALMTALVANEAIPSDTKIDVPRSVFSSTKAARAKVKETFTAADLLYPLLMESSSPVAESLAQTLGTPDFTSWMNAKAKALDLPSTHFADAVGTSTENVSTADDLFRFTAYLAHRKSFILDTPHLIEKDLIASSGNVYPVNTVTAKDTTVSVFSIPINSVERHVAIIVLRSDNAAADTTALVDWFTRSAEQGATMTRALPSPYRKIAF